jgi:hypothetical protein
MEGIEVTETTRPLYYIRGPHYSAAQIRQWQNHSWFAEVVHCGTGEVAHRTTNRLTHHGAKAVAQAWIDAQSAKAEGYCEFCPSVGTCIVCDSKSEAAS